MHKVCTFKAAALLFYPVLILISPLRPLPATSEAFFYSPRSRQLSRDRGTAIWTGTRAVVGDSVIGRLLNQVSLPPQVTL